MDSAKIYNELERADLQALVINWDRFKCRMPFIARDLSIMHLGSKLRKAYRSVCVCVSAKRVLTASAKTESEAGESHRTLTD
ncbi:hypothetical protein LSTR_LSTR007619 [Laodelphax striatellus]|uniref:Uncharacterized protein n=1 Tax=Laodelphax striatellus TaxID=195883 RepID=A0A482WID5_LAOST|nr:hypothetical protein LSTR_LSTR007619 [Laodelphax striatellus]